MAMTLHKKITLGMLTGLVLIFFTVSVINFFIQRQYYRLHLDHATQNIEVALSVFLEPPLREENYELIHDSINEVFDDSLFRMLQVLGPDNEVLITREKLRTTQLANLKKTRQPPNSDYKNW